jgi:hypothetical protein
LAGGTKLFVSLPVAACQSLEARFETDSQP